MKRLGNYPVPFVLINKAAIINDAERSLKENKLRIPYNNGRKIFATDIIPKFKENLIDNPLWEAPAVFPTGEGGIEIATFTEYSSQDRHKHQTGIEIYIVLKGTMKIYVNDEGPYSLNEGDEIVIPPETVHQVIENIPSGTPVNDNFNLLVRVHTINCFGEHDKFVQMEYNGEWKRWCTLSKEDKKMHIKNKCNANKSIQRILNTPQKT